MARRHADGQGVAAAPPAAWVPIGGPVAPGSGPRGTAADAGQRPGSAGAARRGGGRGRRGYDLDSLLEGAAVVFLERGYDGASMEDVAAGLGITKSAIYHHVSGKAELLRLSVDRALDDLFAVLDEPGASTGSAAQRLEHVVRGSVRVLVERLPFVTLLLRVRGNTEVEREALARRRELDHRVTALVAEAGAEGSVRADMDPALVSRLLFGMVNSLVEWYRPGGELGSEQLADVLVALAFGGLTGGGDRRADPGGDDR